MTDARSLVFAVGDDIAGWGRLVGTSAGTWFDPPLPVPLAIRPPAGPSEFGVPVEGADLDAVEHHVERDGIIEGLARIEGRWLGDRIVVRRQTTGRPTRREPQWSEPPCPPPPGGWPRGREHDNPQFDHADLDETGAAVSVVVFRPSPDQAVLVVAATDVAAVEARLRPQLADRLCVVPSRVTRQQVDDAHAHVRARREHWGVYTSGETCDDRAQAVITVQLVRVTEEIARWADDQPAGLVVLEPWLAPVG